MESELKTLKEENEKIQLELEQLKIDNLKAEKAELVKQKEALEESQKVVKEEAEEKEIWPSR